jgi:dienelactone hydrolase
MTAVRIERSAATIGGSRAAGWGIALTILSVLAAAGGVRAATVEAVTFQTNVVPDSENDRPVRVKSKLYLPASPKFPLSAVIITPSSGGVLQEREVYYANELAAAGMAALVIDSFASRGLTDSIEDQRVLDAFESANDAVAGLRWLSADRRFRPDRIGIMGVSKGGIVAMDTALEVRRKWMRMTDIAFAVHVPISPDCTWINRSTRTTGAPIFFMLAELDDQTPAPPCVERAERLREAGNDRIEVKVYRGAHHAWERLGPAPILDRRAENYSRCRVWVEDDGTMIAAGDGARVPGLRWHDWAKKTCMRLGTHCCGGTPELKRQATDDLIGFLKKHGF